MKTSALLCTIALTLAAASCSKEANLDHNSHFAAATPEQAQPKTEFESRVEASSGLDVYFAVAGSIESVNVHPGDKVSKGALLAKLDDESFKQTYREAEARMHEAQQRYDAQQALFKAGKIGEAQLITDHNALRDAQGAVALAKRSLDESMIYAPIEGYVEQQYGEAGAAVAADMPMFKLAVIDPVSVQLVVPQEEIAKISVNHSAHVTVSALGGKDFEGRVVERSMTADPTSTDFIVKIAIDNPNLELRPGMACSVSLADQSSPRLTLQK